MLLWQDSREQTDMITSSNNAKVKQVVQWQTKAKERRKDHVFLAEGVRMCEEAPVKSVREVYLTEELEQKLRRNAQNGDTAFWDKLQQTGYETVSPEVFAKMADTQTPQGILTVLEQPSYDLTQLLEQPEPLFLILENLQDPGNLGTMIRTGEGAGITGVIMNQQTVDIFNPKTIRATMGSIFRIESTDNIQVALQRIMLYHPVVPYFRTERIVRIGTGEGCNSREQLHGRSRAGEFRITISI